MLVMSALLRDAPFYAASALGAIPLAGLGWLRVRGRRRGAFWWWMAAAFSVSCLADVAGGLGYASEASQVYPVLQAGLVVALLLPRRYAEWGVGAILLAASASIVSRDAAGLDVLLRVVAFGGVSAVAWWRLPASALRTALLVYFAGGALAWYLYAAAPGYVTWGLLQGTRLVGLVGWCSAAAREGA